MDAARKHSLHSGVSFHTTTPSVEQWLHVWGVPPSGTATGTTLCSVCTNNFVGSYRPRTFEIARTSPTHKIRGRMRNKVDRRSRDVKACRTVETRASMSVTPGQAGSEVTRLEERVNV